MTLIKGQLEDEITKAMTNWEREYMGRGPDEAKTDILRNMVIVTLRGVLSKAEQHLARDREGAALVKNLRQQLVEQGREELEGIITKITSAKVISLHTDISTKTGERIFVLIIDRNL